MRSRKGVSVLKTIVLRGKVLGVSVYRGFAPLSALSRISMADIYDRQGNPEGTQRDLSPKHAREAYEYARARNLAFWPEVFLCVRDHTCVKFRPKFKEDSVFGELTVEVPDAQPGADIRVSRLDGNHRLHYADGLVEGFPPIDREVSFCLAFDLSREDEIALFRDINDNQRRMNTSHLDNIEARLSTDDSLKKRDPALYIARKLGTDSSSPLYERTYEGGAKPSGALIPLRTLKIGMEYMFSRPTKLTALRDVEAQYEVIKNYFTALKLWIPDAWSEPRKYLALRGAGLWGICFIGAEVIDRVLTKGQFEPKQMHALLVKGKEWDWSSKGDFDGLSGRGGAVKISDQVVAELPLEQGASIADLAKRITRS